MINATEAGIAPSTAKESDVPEGWASVEVQEIFHSFGGGTPNRATAAFWGGSILWISSGDVKTERIAISTETITKAGLENSSANLCRRGSVLVVVRSGILKHTLPVAVLEREATINQDIKCFDSGSLHLNEWLALALRSSAREILAANREGTTVQSVKYQTLKQFGLPVPPFAEQTRILDTVDQALQHVNVGRERLAVVPKILKRFRQSVLAAACSGRLTEDWRDKQCEVRDAKELFKSPHASKKSRKRAGRLWGGGAVPELADEDRANIPEHWTWAKVSNLGEDPSETVQVGPMSMQSRDFADHGIPVLNVGCVQYGWFDESKLNFLPTPKAVEFSRYRIRSGDVLFTRSGTIGRCAVAGQLQDGHLMTFHLFRVRASRQKCLPNFLQAVFQGAPHIRKQMEEAAIGSTRAGFNTNLLAGLDVPIPPLAEQAEILGRVEALFKLADAIEKRVAAAQLRADKLTQSILAKAFRGELVPTEAELARQEGRGYEPASVLLERIRAERESLNERRDSPVKRKRRSGNRDDQKRGIVGETQ